MSEWRDMVSAPVHDRGRQGSTGQPRVIGSDGEDVFEMRNHDGQWYRGDEAVDPVAWQPLPELPEKPGR